MCGFVAMIGLNGRLPVKHVVLNMTHSIKHRGPDEEGTFFSGPVGFGFRRLSILDLSPAAHQPMLSPDKRLVLIFNGEIYNYKEIREELKSLGHQFKSTGDTEVLLHAYIQWGSECLNKLNGMWAFLIYDMHRQIIFGSRDRFGKKPLYRFKTGDHVFFFSEIKSILESGHYQRDINWEMAARFLLKSNLDTVVQGSQTFFKDIVQVSASTAFEIDLNGNYRDWVYWSLPDQNSFGHDESLPESFYGILRDSVNLRLRSDVPLGVFLSGGLDSTSVVCSIADILKVVSPDANNGLTAFSYHAPEFDESKYVDETVQSTGANLTRFMPTPTDLWDRLNQFLWYQDEPVHSFASIIFFELCKLAKQNGIKVILAGGGADEYIAGYFNYFRTYWHSLARELKFRELLRETTLFCKVHGANHWQILSTIIRSLLSHELHRIALTKATLHKRQIHKIKSNSWFSKELTKHFTENHLEYKKRNLHNDLKRSVELFPLPLYLREDDRSTMAHSIEGRSPFLDYRLVEFTFQLHDHWKLKGSWNKYILREAMKNKIPENIRTRPDKMGFSIPQKKWFSGSLYEPLRDLIASQSFRERGIYQTTAIKRDLEYHKQGEIDMSSRFFNLLQFELWHQLKIHN